MRILIPVLFSLFLLSGCNQSTSVNPASTLTLVPNISDKTEGTFTATPISIIEETNPTASPEPTPTPTSIPVTNFEKANYRQFTGTLDMNSYLPDAMGVRRDQIIYLNFADAPSSGTFAAYGCLYTCDMEGGGKYFLIVADTVEPEKTRVIDYTWESRIVDLVISPDGEYVYFSLGGDVYRYDLATWNILPVHKANVSLGYAYLGISPDGKNLAVSNKSSVTLISLPSKEVLKTLNGSFYGNLQSAQFSNDGKFMFIPTGDSLSQVTIYETTNWNVVNKLETPGMQAAAISPDGRYMALAYPDQKEVKIVDTITGNMLFTISVALQNIRKTVFSPTSDLLLVVGTAADDANLEDNILVVDTGTGQTLDPIPTYIVPYTLWFMENGNSFMLADYSQAMLEKWTLPTDNVIAARDFIVEYFNDIASGDYAAAAEKTSLDDLEKDLVIERGQDPNDLVNTFTNLCSPDEVPCLPLGSIIQVKASNLWDWDYHALVTLQEDDGTNLVFEGITQYAIMGIDVDNQGILHIVTLHPGMVFPFPD